MICLDKILFTD